MNITMKCKNYRSKSIYASGLSINNRLNSDFINAVNNPFKLNCIDNGWVFIENSKISTDNSSQNSLRLSSSGKDELLNKFSSSYLVPVPNY